MAEYRRTAGWVQHDAPRKWVCSDNLQCVVAATACLAGWYWPSGETGGDLSRYLLALSPVILLVVIILVILHFLSYVSAFFLDGRSPGASKDE